MRRVWGAIAAVLLLGGVASAQQWEGYGEDPSGLHHPQLEEPEAPVPPGTGGAGEEGTLGAPRAPGDDEALEDEAGLEAGTPEVSEEEADTVFDAGDPGNRLNATVPEGGEPGPGSPLPDVD